MKTLAQLVETARLDSRCSQGHDWTDEGTGARACPREEDCGGSQGVYVCRRCGEIDYGERGGPGYHDCWVAGPCVDRLA